MLNRRERLNQGERLNQAHKPIRECIKEVGIKVATIFAIGTTAIGITSCAPDRVGAKEQTTASAPSTTGAGEVDPSPSNPVPTTSATDTFPAATRTLPDIEPSYFNGEVDRQLLEKYVATVDKYPTTKDAVNALFAGPNLEDKTGVYNKLMYEVGLDGVRKKPVPVPQEAIIALYGPEPEDGYPESVRKSIDAWNEKYADFRSTYFATGGKTPYDDEGWSDNPFRCLYALNVYSHNNSSPMYKHGSATGEFTQHCEGGGSIIDHDSFNWTMREAFVMDRYYLDTGTGKEVKITGNGKEKEEAKGSIVEAWRIIEVRDIEEIKKK